MYSQFTLDAFFGAVHNAVHSPDPLPLRPALQVLGHALGGGHLLNEYPAAFFCLLVQVGKVGVQSARQGQVVEQKRVRFLQICPVHPPPLPDGAVIILRQFDSRDVVVPGQDVIKAIRLVMDTQF